MVRSNEWVLARTDSSASLECWDIVVMASGNGSNLQALIAATESGDLAARIAAVVSNRGGSGALDLARRSGVSAWHCPMAPASDTVNLGISESLLLDRVLSFRPGLVILAGWMRILSPRFLERLPCPIINVHPALLPYEGETLEVPILRGARAVHDALELGLPYTGVTVHHVIPAVDSGPVIERETVAILPGDDEPSLHARLKAVEHRLLPLAAGRILRSPLSHTAYLP